MMGNIRKEPNNLWTDGISSRARQTIHINVNLKVIYRDTPEIFRDAKDVAMVVGIIHSLTVQEASEDTSTMPISLYWQRIKDTYPLIASRIYEIDDPRNNTDTDTAKAILNAALAGTRFGQASLMNDSNNIVLSSFPNGINVISPERYQPAFQLAFRILMSKEATLHSQKNREIQQGYNR